MKLFLISRPDDLDVDYDEYESAVVCCEDEEVARNMHPATGAPIDETNKWRLYEWIDTSLVQVKYIGEAAPDIIKGVVLASFHAG